MISAELAVHCGFDLVGVGKVVHLAGKIPSRRLSCLRQLQPVGRLRVTDLCPVGPVADRRRCRVTVGVLSVECNFDCCKGVRNSITVGTLNCDLTVNYIVRCDEVTTDKSLACSRVFHNVPAIYSVDRPLVVGPLLLTYCILNNPFWWQLYERWPLSLQL